MANLHNFQSFVNPCNFGNFLKTKTLLIVHYQGFIRFDVVSCDPAGIRTQDHYIKSVMLYQLSYGISFKPFSLTARSYFF